MIHQAGEIEALPIEAETVAVHHLHGGAFDRDRGPDRKAERVEGDRDLLHRGPELTEGFGAIPDQLVHLGLGIGEAKTLLDDADAQIADLAGKGFGIAVGSYIDLAWVQSVRTGNDLQH